MDLLFHVGYIGWYVTSNTAYYGYRGVRYLIMGREETPEEKQIRITREEAKKVKDDQQSRHDEAMSQHGVANDAQAQEIRELRAVVNQMQQDMNRLVDAVVERQTAIGDCEQRAKALHRVAFNQKLINDDVQQP